MEVENIKCKRVKVLEKEWFIRGNGCASLWVCVFAYVVGTRQQSLRRKCLYKHTQCGNENIMHKGFSECLYREPF